MTCPVTHSLWRIEALLSERKELCVSTDPPGSQSRVRCSLAGIHCGWQEEIITFDCKSSCSFSPIGNNAWPIIETMVHSRDKNRHSVCNLVSSDRGEVILKDSWVYWTIISMLELHFDMNAWTFSSKTDYLWQHAVFLSNQYTSFSSALSTIDHCLKWTHATKTITHKRIGCTPHTQYINSVHPDLELTR